MADKLRQVEERVSRLLGIIERLRQENRALRTERSSLQSKIQQASSQFAKLAADTNARSNTVKSKLQTVLKRIEELESLSR